MNTPTNPPSVNGVPIHDASDLEAATQAAAYPIVGWQVWWRLGNVHATHADLTRILQALGLERFRIEKPSPRAVMRAALEAWIDDRARNGTGARKATGAATGSATSANPVTKRDMIRVMEPRGEEHVIFQIVGEAADFAALRLDYGTQVRIKLHKKTGAWTVTTTASGDIDAITEAIHLTPDIRRFYDYYADRHMSGDISRVLTAIMAEIGVGIRETGGVYYVPLTEELVLNAAREFLRVISLASREPARLWSIGVPDTARYREEMADATWFGMLDQVEALQSDLDRLLADDAKKPGSVRQDTLLDRMTAYQRVLDQVSVFQQLLGMRQDVIADRIAAMQASAAAVLMQVRPAKPPKATSPAPSGE